MEQVIIGGYYSQLDTTDTEYNSLSGGFTWTATKANRYQLISTDGYIKNLRVKLNNSPGAGNKYTFTLMLNGAPTALTFDIENLETSGGDMVNKIDVTGGDYVCIQCDPVSSPTARYANWTSTFEGDTPNESLILGGSYLPLDNSATEYGQIATSACSNSINENNYRQVCPTDGTLKNFYVKLSEDPGTSPDAYEFTVRVNGAEPANTLLVTIFANDTTGNDVAHTVDVSAGDILTLKIEPVNTPAATPAAYWGVTFEADVDGESIILGGTIGDLDRSATEYNTIQSGEYNIMWDNAEAERYQLGQVCTIKKLHILLNGTPGAGKKYDFTVRVAGAGSNVVATVSALNTTGNSGVLEDTVDLDEYIDLESDPDSSPTARDAYWGLVCFTEEAPPAGVGMGAKPPIMELLLAGVIN